MLITPKLQSTATTELVFATFMQTFQVNITMIINTCPFHWTMIESVFYANL